MVRMLTTAGPTWSTSSVKSGSARGCGADCASAGATGVNAATPAKARAIASPQPRRFLESMRNIQTSPEGSGKLVGQRPRRRSPGTPNVPRIRPSAEFARQPGAQVQLYALLTGRAGPGWGFSGSAQG